MYIHCCANVPTASNSKCWERLGKVWACMEQLLKCWILFTKVRFLLRQWRYVQQLFLCKWSTDHNQAHEAGNNVWQTFITLHTFNYFMCSLLVGDFCWQVSVRHLDVARRQGEAASEGKINLVKRLDLSSSWSSPLLAASTELPSALPSCSCQKAKRWSQAGWVVQAIFESTKPRVGWEGQSLTEALVKDV